VSEDEGSALRYFCRRIYQLSVLASQIKRRDRVFYLKCARDNLDPVTFQRRKAEHLERFEQLRREPICGEVGDRVEVEVRQRGESTVDVRLDPIATALETAKTFQVLEVDSVDARAEDTTEFPHAW